MQTDPDIENQADNDSEENGSQQSPGSVLQAERLRQDLTEKQVADRLHITMHYVRSVEDDRYDKLPGAVFAKGYIKSYAELLRLDSDELVSAYENYVSNREARKEEKQRIRSERRRARNLPWVYASVVGFVAAFGALWLINNMGDEDTEVVNQAPAAQSTPTRIVGPGQAAPPAPIPESDPEPVEDTQPDLPTVLGELAQQAEAESGPNLIEIGSSGDDLLRISFSGESWIEVNDEGSNTVYRDIREAGDILEIHGTAPFNILLGDAPFTRLSFNGTEIDVSEDIRIDNSARLTVGL